MNFKILVIDDEPTLRDALQVALTHSGYESCPAGRARKVWTSLTGKTRI